MNHSPLAAFPPMARYAQEREDLLRDATAFDHRVKLRVTLEGQSTEVFAGFRKNGCVSLYFGADPVYQFNSRRQLRRAYVDGQLVKAVKGNLVGWRPQRTQAKVEMLSRELDAEELRHFCKTMKENMQRLRDSLANHRQEVLGHIPAEVDVLDELKTWLFEWQTLEIADSPGAL
ncbi:MAG: hypothetical protein MI725_02475 [Pirellulales bacterium]|nr:hypothetical protein [Pirellulales bacterium]